MAHAEHCNTGGGDALRAVPALPPVAGVPRPRELRAGGAQHGPPSGPSHPTAPLPARTEHPRGLHVQPVPGADLQLREAGPSNCGNRRQSAPAHSPSLPPPLPALTQAVLGQHRHPHGHQPRRPRAGSGQEADAAPRGPRRGRVELCKKRGNDRRAPRVGGRGVLGGVPELCSPRSSRASTASRTRFHATPGALYTANSPEGTAAIPPRPAASGAAPCCGGRPCGPRCCGRCAALRVREPRAAPRFVPRVPWF